MKAMPGAEASGVLSGGYANGPLYGHWQKKPLSDED